jgi:hypothetical protein
MVRCYMLGVLIFCFLICCAVPGAAYAQGTNVPGYPLGPITPDGNSGLSDGMDGVNPYYSDSSYTDPANCPPPSSAYNLVPQRPETTFAGWWFRTEYLFWNFSRPGAALLGSPVAGVLEPRIPHSVFDDSTNPPTFQGLASTPTTDQLRLTGVSGVRGTLGIPLVFGTFEGNIFGFQTRNANLIRTDLVGTSVLTNGQPGDTVFLYNNGLNLNFKSQFWGTEENILFDGPTSNFFSLRPLVGFRGMSLREALNQNGQYIPDPSTGLPTTNSNIYSASTNAIFAGQIGLRLAMDSKYVSLAITPKVGLGGDVYRNRVSTDHLRSANDGHYITQDKGALFVQTINIPFTGKLHLTQNFSLVGGYEFFWVNGITRPQNNIYYNDNGPTPVPGVVVNTSTTTFIAYGMTLGGELHY